MLFKRPLIFLANESATADSQTIFISRNLLVSAANEAADNWIQLSPFGDFNNAKGMQRIRKEDAQSIVNEFHSPLNVEARIGLPWYVGHPDYKGFEKKYPDTEAKGRIKDLQVRHDTSCKLCNEFCSETSDEPCHDHGLFARVKWNENGKRLIANEAYHGHSVNWGGAYIGGFFRPMVLKSVGFTNEPQIPVPPITTANERTIMENTPKTLMDYIKLLTGKDITESTACNEMADWYNTKYKPMMDSCKNDKDAMDLVKPVGLTDFGGRAVVLVLANELVTARGEKTTLVNEKTKLTSDLADATSKLAAKAGEIQNLTSEKSTLVNERDAARTNLANEVAAHATSLGARFIAEGRISAAELETVVNEAKEKGATVVNERVSKLPTKWLPNSRTTNLKNKHVAEVGEESRREQVLNFVNEKMDAAKAKGRPITYGVAYAAVQKEKPELFAEMKQPEGVAKNGN